jgi:hypothetical protein
MARTWSNTQRITNEISAAQRARMARPSSITSFIIALIATTIFFLGLTLYSTYQSVKHPVIQFAQPVTDQPKDG